MSNISFDKIVEKVFDGFKKVTPALVAIAIMTGMILFFPISLLGKLGLNRLPQSIIVITGLLFLLSCTLILTIIGSVFFQKLTKQVKHKRWLRNMRNRYLQLSLTQKIIIYKLLNSSSKSIELDGLSGDTLYLSEYNFIHRPEQIVDELDLYNNQYTYVPQLWLIDLFHNEPELFNIDFRKESK